VSRREPVVFQVYCRLEVVVEDPAQVTEVAVRRLREADIDWSAECDTLEEAAAELQVDLPQVLASLVDPDAMLAGVPGVDTRGGRLWAEPGAPSPRFHPGFVDPEER